MQTLLLVVPFVIFSLAVDPAQVQGLISTDSGVYSAPPLMTIPGNRLQQSVEVKRKPLTCICEESEHDIPLCASNGVTYKNLCRFNCAKSKVKRLRQVKEGPCNSLMTRNEFWKHAE